MMNAFAACLQQPYGVCMVADSVAEAHVTRNTQDLEKKIRAEDLHLGFRV